jgi:GPI-anchor transamidase subunit T
MPYNVIILSSTVIALAFGSVFNLLVRRFVALEAGDVVVGNKLRALVLTIVRLVKARLDKVRQEREGVMPKSEGDLVVEEKVAGAEGEGKE